MVLTFDGQVVGVRRGLAGHGVVCLARVRAGVFVNGLLNGVLRCFDLGHCAVKLPGEAGGWDGRCSATERHVVVDLYSLFPRHLGRFWTNWTQSGIKERSLCGFDDKGFNSSES